MAGTSHLARTAGQGPREQWPALPLASWQDTYATLHMYVQIVGKIRLLYAPMTNEWWQIPLYVTVRGLTTSPIPYGTRTFSLDVDFIDHDLLILTSDGEARRIKLGGAVKDFYRRVLSALHELHLSAAIWTQPVEVPQGIPFDADDVHDTYDPEAVGRFFQILRQVDTVFKRFRARFTGKSSPVHFFWGSFDLAVTRFSGRPAPPRPGADAVTRLAYDAELTSVGFWPGGDWPGAGRVDGPLFYAYAYPEPAGYADQPVKPRAAGYHPPLHEFILPYEAVRRSTQPEQRILDFAQSTYEAGARLQHWPMQALTMTVTTPPRAPGQTAA